MAAITLTNTTEDDRVNEILCGLVEICELLFPGRIRAYYLTGSSLDGTAVRLPGDSLNSSDIDVTVVFKGTLGEGEAARFKRCRAACEALSGLGLDQLDASAVGERTLTQEGSLTLRGPSLLLGGEDIRHQVPLPRLDEHIRRAVRTSTDIMATLRGVPATAIAPPLAYPDPAGECYGYDFGDPAYGGHRGTRLLVDGLCWGATAVLAIKAACYATSKREAVRLYQELIADEWGTLVEQVYQRCKGEWRYALPPTSDSRHQLRHLCQRVLAFENHLLETYHRSREDQR
jgi:hypothetical protein